MLASFPVLWLLTRWFRNQSERAYRATRDAVALVIVHFVESLGGIQAVHAFRREPRNQEIFDHLDDRYRDANVWSQRLAAAYGPGVQFVGRMTTAIVLFYGGWLAIDGQVSVGVLAAFLLYLRRFFEPMQELSQFYNLFQAAAAGLEKLSGVLDEPPSVPEPESPGAAARTRAARCAFDGVEFAYRERAGAPASRSRHPGGPDDRARRRDRRGQDDDRPARGALLGPDGGPRARSTASTCATSTETTCAARSSMVTQENFLFTGSVADNIGLGRPDAIAARDRSRGRARSARDEFIAALPDGYDTDVHQKGARLSAGQRQLVAFARAFLADPAVLILDEATSSLDIPSERLVQRALRTLLADRTAVIIAHRLTTVEIADRVLVLESRPHRRGRRAARPHRQRRHVRGPAPGLARQPRLIGALVDSPDVGSTSSATRSRYGHASSGGRPPHNGCSGRYPTVRTCATASSTETTRCAPFSARSASTVLRERKARGALVVVPRRVRDRVVQQVRTELRPRAVDIVGDEDRRRDVGTRQDARPGVHGPAPRTRHGTRRRARRRRSPRRKSSPKRAGAGGPRPRLPAPRDRRPARRHRCGRDAHIACVDGNALAGERVEQDAQVLVGAPGALAHRDPVERELLGPVTRGRTRTRRDRC